LPTSGKEPAWTRFKITFFLKDATVSFFTISTDTAVLEYAEYIDTQMGFGNGASVAISKEN